MAKRLPQRCPQCGVLMLRISWSSLRTWEECNHKWAKKKTSAPAITNGRVFLPGTVADRVQRMWLESGNPQPGQMVDMVPEMMRKYAAPETAEEREEAGYVIKWRGNPKEDYNRVQNTVIEAVTKLEPILMDLIVPYKYEPEVKFETPVFIPYIDGQTVRKVMLIGGIDIVARPDSFTLWDLKTTADKDYIAKVLGQGVFYDVAWGHYCGDMREPKSFGFIAPLLEQPVIMANISDDDRRALMARVIAFAHSRWRNDPQKPKVSNAGCSECEVHHACDKFKVGTSGKRMEMTFAQVAAHRKGVSK